MSQTDAFSARVQGFRLAEWEELPDLGLYMDQLVTYLERQFRPLFEEDRRIITPAMINNYVKSGLVARPAKKKYDRPQIAQLIMLCGLKHALSLEDLRTLTAAKDTRAIETMYRSFCAQLTSTQAALAGKLATLTPMGCAVMGAAYSLLSQALLSARATEKED